VPDIRIHREHQLGLAKARKIAWQWAEEVEDQFGMECTVIEGETSDTVEFTRSGCHGRLIVAADHFDLDAKLGFLLGAFSGTIESQIQKNLDDLLAAGGKPAKAAPKDAPKNAAKNAAKSAAKDGPKGKTKAAAKKK
jgi:putative polyhydroxyalkanoate system protein